MLQVVAAGGGGDELRAHLQPLLPVDLGVHQGGAGVEEQLLGRGQLRNARILLPKEMHVLPPYQTFPYFYQTAPGVEELVD